MHENRLNKKYIGLAKCCFFAPISFMLIWIFTILMGVSENSGRWAWPLTIASMVVFILIFIIIIFKLITLKNQFKPTKKIETEFKKNYLNQYLKIQIVYFGIIIFGIVFTLLGVQIKNLLGIIFSIIGLVLIGVGLGIYLYQIINRLNYREKKGFVTDIIKEEGLYSSLSILERFLILLFIIVLFILSYFQIKEKQSIIFVVILNMMFLSFYTLIVFFIVRTLKRIKKIK